MLTPIHAKYYAHELKLKKGYGNEERIAESLFDSILTINPHQIDAALFAFRSPLSKGVILADEVGLGKTIEAGLVMSQLYAEGKTRQIVICPSSLRKQWSLELKDKFNLDSIIFEKKEYDTRKKTRKNPFDVRCIIIVSYHFASKMYEELGKTYFDLVIMDEAHKLRNVYKKTNKMANNIRLAFEGEKKLLLTATPLQNNLLELYGLSTFISDHIFGDEKSFKDQYIREENIIDLKNRIKYLSKRTLRKDVLEYVKYTERKAILKEFIPSEKEQILYEGVSNLLLREDSYSIPKSQKKLTTLMIRKLLASSTYAVEKTLITIKERLELIYNDEFDNKDINGLFDEDEQEIANEIMEEDNSEDTYEEIKIDKEKLCLEIDELERLIELAKKIHIDAKSKSLLGALEIGFKELQTTGANKKALIFTESRRTQDYLKGFLEKNGYKDKICIFNGSNTGHEVKKIYDDWLEKNKDTGRTSGSVTADKRNAILEYFKNNAEIMIATESAAEGVNLQFCSLVINYDMPWNPQRIEQRIGRCHRYGQKNDVVVINFVNKNNYADQRVYALLQEKFKLFDGIFGTSDEILGSLESGVDFEKEILEIYQSCRTKKEIDEAFKKLQKSMEKEISKSMERVEKEIFSNFDISVQDKLMSSIEGHLDRYGRMFWNLTRYQLSEIANFDNEKKEFYLNQTYKNNKPGFYQMVDKVRKEDDYTGIIYRTTHPLGSCIIGENLGKDKIEGLVKFDITNHMGAKLSSVELLKGQAGVFTAVKTKLSSFDLEEEIILVGFDKQGNELQMDVLKRLLECSGYYSSEEQVDKCGQVQLRNRVNEIILNKLQNAERRNVEFIKEEEIRLRRWTQDKILSVENDLDNIKKAIRETQNLLLKTETLEEQLMLNEKLMRLNKKKRNIREELDTNEDIIERMRLSLINEIKERSNLTEENEVLFSIKWEVI